MNKLEDMHDVIKRLLESLNKEDKYLAIASIPGPNLELRSGTLPSQDMDYKHMRNDLIHYFDLSSKCLNDNILEIEKQYSINEIINAIGNVLLDSESFKTYICSFIKAMENKLLNKSIFYNKSEVIQEIDLTINQKKLKIFYPDELVSVGLINEVFIENSYKLEEQVQNVDCIYDLGANIGLSALYFSAYNDNCKIVCVEPFPDNVKKLERNMKVNGVNAEIVPAAVGNSDESILLYYSDQSHALPSLYTVQNSKVEVQCIPLDKLMTRHDKHYGIKIDIEGSEALLCDYQDLLKDANFITGELHYSKDNIKNSKVDEFYNIINRNFKVTVGRPIVYFVNDDVELCYCFRAVKCV